MQRTNLFMTDEQRYNLIAEGKARGMSMAEVIRELVDTHVPKRYRKPKTTLPRKGK